MLYVVLADAVVFAHALFVLFVVIGGALVLRWRRLAWIHLPAAAWGVAIELGGWICPLTYLENYLRRLGGESGYGGTFIEHYLEPLLYPLGLTTRKQIFLALAAFLINAAFYSLFRRNRNRSKDGFQKP